MINSVILSALLVLFTIALAQDDLCTQSMKGCDLRVEGYMDEPGVFPITGIVDRSFTPKFVTGNNNGVIIGLTNYGSKAPDFIFTDKIEPITDYGFVPTAFKSYAVGNGSGIGHQSLEPMQLSFAKSKCIRVWFSFFQLKFPPTFELVNFERSPPGDTDCVVIRTQ